MAALLVGLSVMSVMMAAAMPVWSHATRREREEELIWRGEQYRRAIMLFQRKYANTFPPNLDILVEQKFLRKKYKDPITGEDFQIIPVGGMMPGGGVPGSQQPGAKPPVGQAGGGFGTPGGGGLGSPGGGLGSPGGGLGSPGGGGLANPGGGGFGTPGGSGFGTQSGGSFGGSSGGLGSGGQQPAGGLGQVGGGVAGTQPNMGIQGVTSKSKETSIKQYNGMTKYNQWAFVYLATSGQAGFGGAQFQRPGQGVNQGFGQPGGVGRPGSSGFGQPGSSGFGQPGGLGQPASQPKFPPVPSGGFGTPGGQPSGPSPFKPAGTGPFGQPIPPR